MSPQQTKTKELYERASRVIPFGVNSNFRYWGPEDTLVVTRGEGPYVWDADGKRYIDYRMGFGPVILGHAYSPVVERVAETIRRDGEVFALTTVHEIELAERFTRMTGTDMVRLANSGTEATMHALRIARAHTGRERFVKFEGQYHGMSDYYLFSTASAPRGALGSLRSPLSAPASSGIPYEIGRYVVSLPYNEPEILESTVRAKWGDLAAIIVEPTMGNAGGILPESGWLELIRRLCDEYGIVMIMDEVKTGFRIANGGAQAHFRVRADLATYAKAMANGFPIAAFAGREDVMMTLEPGSVACGGTYAGNVVSVSAALATLEILEKEPILETIHARGRMLMSGLSEILHDAGIPNHILGHPGMFGFAVGSERAPKGYRDLLACDGHLYERISTGLARRGAMPDPDGREPWFLSYSHSEKDIADTLGMFEDAVREAKG
jgi:glutamate-1-semialdehyde 2,1-aminomutase